MTDAPIQSDGGGGGGGGGGIVPIPPILWDTIPGGVGAQPPPVGKRDSAIAQLLDTLGDRRIFGFRAIQAGTDPAADANGLSHFHAYNLVPKIENDASTTTPGGDAFLHIGTLAAGKIRRLHFSRPVRAHGILWLSRCEVYKDITKLLASDSASVGDPSTGPWQIKVAQEVANRVLQQFLLRPTLPPVTTSALLAAQLTAYQGVSAPMHGAPAAAAPVNTAARTSAIAEVANTFAAKTSLMYATELEKGQQAIKSMSAHHGFHRMQIATDIGGDIHPEDGDDYSDDGTPPDGADAAAMPPFQSAWVTTSNIVGPHGEIPEPPPGAPAAAAAPAAAPAAASPASVTFHLPSVSGGGGAAAAAAAASPFEAALSHFPPGGMHVTVLSAPAEFYQGKVPVQGD
jgi:hypothetical protein